MLNFVNMAIDKSFFDKFMLNASCISHNNKVLPLSNPANIVFEDLGSCFIILERDLSELSGNVKPIHNYDKFYFIYNCSKQVPLLVFKESIVSGYVVRAVYSYSSIDEGMKNYANILYKKFKAKTIGNFMEKMMFFLRTIEISHNLDKLTPQQNDEGDNGEDIDDNFKL